MRLTSILLLASHLLPAQEANRELHLMDLPTLMEMRVAIASRFEQDRRQAPSVVAVINRGDIEVFGCRDLADILRMVPGFDFGLDASQLFGLSFRGIWGHEGKVLLMVDGVPVNELAFGNSNFYGTYPAAMVERVEVLRGPGSAVYGQFAGVAVVNVLTRTPSGHDGGRLDLTTSSYGAGESRYGATLVARTPIKSEGSLSVNAGILNGPTSRRLYRDAAGGSLALGRENTNRDWEHVLADFRMGGLNLSYHRNQTVWGARDGFTTILPKVNGIDPEAVVLEVEALSGGYAWDPASTLHFEPRFEISRGITGAVLPTSQAYGEFSGPGQALSRRTLEVFATWVVRPQVQLQGGLGWHQDLAKDVSRNNEPGLYGSDRPGDFVEARATRSHFAFAQLSLQGETLGFTVGGRAENTDFGNAVAPRVGLTWVTHDTHAKALYGKAFRIPLPWQAYSRYLTYAGALRPETSTTWEVELGRRFGNRWEATINAFDIDIHSPIVFLGTVGGYQNFGRIRSRGVETALRYRAEGWSAYAHAGWQVPGSDTSEGFLATPGTGLLGMAKYRAGGGFAREWGPVSLSLSATHLGPRPLQTDASSLSGVPHSKDEPVRTLLDAALTWRPLRPGMEVQFAIHNLGAEDYRLGQPYYGGHAPMPTGDREVTLGVRWRF